MRSAGKLPNEKEKWEITVQSRQARPSENKFGQNCTSMISDRLRFELLQNFGHQITAWARDTAHQSLSVQSRRADHLTALHTYDKHPMRSAKTGPKSAGTSHCPQVIELQSRRADHLTALHKYELLARWDLPKLVPNLLGRHTVHHHCVQSKRADHLAALHKYDHPLRLPKLVPNLLARSHCPMHRLSPKQTSWPSDRTAQVWKLARCDCQNWSQICWDVTLPIDRCVQSRRADHLTALHKYENLPLRLPKLVPNLLGRHTDHHSIASKADELTIWPHCTSMKTGPLRLLKLETGKSVLHMSAEYTLPHYTTVGNSNISGTWWDLRKSESVCSLCFAPRRNVTGPVWECTRSQDGPQEKTGMAPFVPKRTRQMPGQLSWPWRDGSFSKSGGPGGTPRCVEGLERDYRGRPP